MTHQPNFWDAADRRDDGMERAARHAGDDWQRDTVQVSGPHNGTETSVMAAVAAAPKISPQKRLLLQWLAHDHYSYDLHEWVEGWTQDEISQRLSFPRSTVCARFNELERDGLIKKTTATRPSRYGRECAVYVPVSAVTRP